MNSLRMCVVCREMKPKEELLRVVRIKGESPKIDLTFKAQGRGAYICKNRNCIENAEKRKVFERCFKDKIGSEIYKSIGDIINE